MISNVTLPAWKEQFFFYVVQRLRAAHGDLTRVAAFLRDTTKDVWTEAPTDDTKLTQPHNSLEGWRIHFKKERAALVSYNTTHGADLQNYDAAARTALTGYLTSTANIGTVFNTIIANYVNGGGSLTQTRVSQADRNTLATAIEAELS